MCMWYTCEHILSFSFCVSVCVTVCDCIPLTGVRLQHVRSELNQPLSGQLDLVQLIAEALVLSVKLGCFCLAKALKGELYNRETASVVMHVGVANPYVQKTCSQ